MVDVPIVVRAPQCEKPYYRVNIIIIIIIIIIKSWLVKWRVNYRL
jgi:hypothetical protein